MRQRSDCIHFPSFNAGLNHCAHHDHTVEKVLFVLFCFELSPENHLRDTISTGHTESCHTLRYAPTYPVADGTSPAPGHPFRQMRCVVCSPQAPSGPEVQLPFLSTGQGGGHTLYIPVRTALVGTLTSRCNLYTFVIIL